jgi:hypothetical protein
MAASRPSQLLYSPHHQMGSLLFNITIVAEAEIPGRLSCNYNSLTLL